ncbi:MAG: NUDIX domain-containing protein [Ignavibacteriales bacterium]|nr:NUDIX domain-containing protein [Ignavibacteriales bacterium]
MPSFKTQFVEVCIFKRENNSAKYLLLQRASNEKLFPNIWQIITAKIEENETALQTAQREIEEETKLKPLALWNVPYVNTFYHLKSDTINFIPFFSAEIANESVPQLSDEHQSYGWFSIAEAKEKLVWDGQKRGLDIVHEYIVGKKEAERLSRIGVMK